MKMHEICLTKALLPNGSKQVFDVNLWHLKKLSQSFQRKTTVQVTPAEFRKRTPKELLSSRHALPRNHLALVGGRRGWTCVLIIFGVATATC